MFHKSPQYDLVNPPGQIVNFERPLKEELKRMKLYDLPRYTYFKCDNGSLLNHPNNPAFLFDRIDGMFSVCHDKDNNVYHFAAWTEVTPVEGFE